MCLSIYIYILYVYSELGEHKPTNMTDMTVGKPPCASRFLFAPTFRSQQKRKKFSRCSLLPLTTLSEWYLSNNPRFDFCGFISQHLQNRFTCMFFFSCRAPEGGLSKSQGNLSEGYFGYIFTWG